jgi:hypothetical protein
VYVLLLRQVGQAQGWGPYRRVDRLTLVSTLLTTGIEGKGGEGLGGGDGETGSYRCPEPWPSVASLKPRPAPPGHSRSPGAVWGHLCHKVLLIKDVLLGSILYLTLYLGGCHSLHLITLS